MNRRWYASLTSVNERPLSGKVKGSLNSRLWVNAFQRAEGINQLRPMSKSGKRTTAEHNPRLSKPQCLGGVDKLVTVDTGECSLGS